MSETDDLRAIGSWNPCPICKVQLLTVFLDEPSEAQRTVHGLLRSVGDLPMQRVDIEPVEFAPTELDQPYLALRYGSDFAPSMARVIESRGELRYLVDQAHQSPAMRIWRVHSPDAEFTQGSPHVSHTNKLDP